MTNIPNTLYLSLFPRLKIKLKGGHSDTTEVMEAELQAGLNTLTERLPGLSFTVYSVVLVRERTIPT
jgi:hypothetical protein